MNLLVKHYEECFLKHGDNCKGVDWPNKEDADKRYRVMLDILRFDEKPGMFIPSFLDYGCGLGHLWEYINEHRVLCGYSGYDVSQVMIDHCRKKHNTKWWYTVNPPAMDYVIMNGVFTERVGMTEEEAWDNLAAEFIRALALCNRGVAFNVMNEKADRKREELFVVEVKRLVDFITNFSDKYIIRSDYKLFETTVYVYKDKK